MPEYKPDIHGRAFANDQSQGLGHFGLLASVPCPPQLINMS